MASSRKIRCRVCGRWAAGALQTCPHCGAYLEPKPWPVLQFSLGAVVLVGLLFGIWQVRPSVSNGLEWVALQVNPPTATFTATATATATSTSTPTTTPTFTLTPTPTSTSTPIPTPTSTPTPQPTAAPVVAVAQPTNTPEIEEATPTPAPRFGKPVLLGPPDGQVFVRDDELILSWQDMGILADNEWYAVRLTWLQDGQLSYGGNNIKQNFWRVPADFYWGLADQDTGRQYEWYVFIEAITTDENGQQLAQPVSEASDISSFLWQ
jgi:hypothetical protein